MVFTQFRVSGLELVRVRVKVRISFLFKFSVIITTNRVWLTFPVDPHNLIILTIDLVVAFLGLLHSL